MKSWSTELGLCFLQSFEVRRLSAADPLGGQEERVKNSDSWAPSESSDLESLWE